jgi:DNA-binding NarL/FixJ family response regulator
MTELTTPPVTTPIRVMVIEDDLDFQRAAMEAVTSAGELQLVAVAGTCAEGLALLARTQVDVLLVDLGLPDGSGLTVIRQAMHLWPHCDVMVCTVFGDEQHVMQSIAAGAKGYLLKENGPQRIVEEIHSLVAGGSPISPMIARHMLLRFRSEVLAADDTDLHDPSYKSNAAAAHARSQVSTHSQPHSPVYSPAHSRTPVLAHPLAPHPAPSSTSADAHANKPSLSPREHEVLSLITRGFTVDEIAKLLNVTRHTVLTFVRRAYNKLNVHSKAEAIYEMQTHG